MSDQRSKSSPAEHVADTCASLARRRHENEETALLPSPPAPRESGLRLIYSAMTAVLRDIGAVGKDKRNKEQGYEFRSIEAVMSAMHDVLAANGVFFVPQPLERIAETRTTRGGAPMNVVHLHMRYTFIASDGSSVTAQTWGEGTDIADKATNKAMAAALKYALTQTFCIPFPMDDSDQSAEPAGHGQRSPAEPAATQWEGAVPVTSPDWLRTVREEVASLTKRAPGDPEAVGFANAIWTKTVAAVRDGTSTTADAARLQAMIRDWAKIRSAPAAEQAAQQAPEVPE